MTQEVNGDTGRRDAPTLDEIRECRERLGARVRETPVWEWQGGRFQSGPRPILKLELLQYSGSFKVRGVFSNLLELDDASRARGITAVSAGNHAMAVSHAARELGLSAKVVMPTTANPARVQGCRELGAEIVLIEGLSNLFDEVKKIEAEEGRTFVHPFDGFPTIRGSASLGLELMQQVPDLDAVVVPIGGGGLCAGVASAVKQTRPDCRVIGVEPVGAALMHRSFESGQPERMDRPDTIADSLAAPFTADYSLGVCREFVDELVTVSDDDLCRAMVDLFREAKLAVEPAGAAATAALAGPLRDSLAQRRVGLIVCGANIDPTTFAAYLKRGEDADG